MPDLSEFSINNLSTCDLRLQNVVLEVAKIYDVRVLEGRRTWARQRELFMQEKTTLMPPSSKHTPDTEGDVDYMSLAVDLAPYPIDWKDGKRFCYLAGLMMATAASQGLKLRWGGNWDRDQVILDDQNFDDLPHFEIYE
jgi:peptidoglycan L-alanyl-D-glutamate endopeptidase CwlK